MFEGEGSSKMTLQEADARLLKYMKQHGSELSRRLASLEKIVPHIVDNQEQLFKTEIKGLKEQVAKLRQFIKEREGP